MRIKLKNHFIFSLCFTILILVNTSCNNKNQSNEVKKTTSSGKFLKFKTAVRSFLEDSKGNIWFGSYNEGVALLKKGEFQYFTVENGLSDNQIRNIYEDKNGIIWFECGIGISNYDGQKIAIYKQRNYDATNVWKLDDKDIWFKGDRAFGYNNLEVNAGVYQYDGNKLSYRTIPFNTTSKSDDERKFE